MRNSNAWLIAVVGAFLLGCGDDAAKFQNQNSEDPSGASPTADANTPVIVEFSANPAQVPAGMATLVRYVVENAQTTTVEVMGGAVLVPGATALSFEFATPPLTATTTFLLTARNGDKVVTAPLVITVLAPEAPPTGPGLLHAGIDSFAASSLDILPGESATLSWKTTNAVEGYLLANDVALMTVATADLASGMQVVNPGVNTVYTLVVTGSDGQDVSAVAGVNVAAGGAVLGGRELYERNVAPILELRCNFCHAGANELDGPDFMGATPADHYATLTGDPRLVSARPEDSLLLLKGEHTGPAFTLTEAQTVTAWLLKEANERGLVVAQPDPGGPVQDYTPRTVAEALDRFGSCMTRTDWDETYGQNEETQAAYQNSTEGRCYACHATGTAGAFLSQSSGDTFDQSRIRPNVMKLVLPTANEDGSFRALVPAYRFRDKGGDQGHPSYQLTAERDQAMGDFVNRTLLRFSDYTKPCPPALP
jgi:hypothetical protein